MIPLIFSSFLLVIGVGLFGGALFGRIRPRRLTLFVLALAAWGMAGCMSFGGQKEGASVPTFAPPTATSMPTQPPEASPTSAPSPTHTTTPPDHAPPPSPTAKVGAAPGESPLPTPTSVSQTAAPTQPVFGQLVFPSARSGNLDLWVMDLTDPEHPTQLTTSPEADVEPRWSPDGSMVLFSSPEGGQNNDIFVINADGTGRRRLLNWPESHEWGAVWSPDGKRIAFTSEKDGNYQLYVMPFSGDGEPVNLMQDEHFYSYPDWSPDGQWLVFVSDLSGNWDIWKVNIAECLDARLSGGDAATACKPEQLTENPDDDFFPRWSPDGSQIAFSSRRFSNRDIYLMDADGGNLTRLTNLPGNDSNPIWALDGKAIIFSRRPQTDWDIFMINVDGTGLWQLTDSPGQDRFGDWKP